MSADSIDYGVDVVFVIDSTESMGPLIDMVKGNVATFHDQLVDAMYEKEKYITSLRLRVVAFRDLIDDPATGIIQIPFHHLPDHQEQVGAWVRSMEAGFGGEEDESSLEALATAITSEWDRGHDRRRHVIVLFTDGPAHSLDETMNRLNQMGEWEEYLAAYPWYWRADDGQYLEMPRTFAALSELWMREPTPMEFAAKRLILFAPQIQPWTTIAQSWGNTVFYPVKPDRGLDDIPFKQILSAVVQSV